MAIVSDKCYYKTKPAIQPQRQPREFCGVSDVTPKSTYSVTKRPKAVCRTDKSKREGGKGRKRGGRGCEALALAF